MKYLNQAQWISAVRNGTQMPVFGKDICLTGRPSKAEIEICGLGQFALFIGDTEINEGIFEPGWTDYRKTRLYSTYDVTDHLTEGENRLRVMLGNGMYHEDGLRYAKFTGSCGDPVLIAALSVEYPDGTQALFVTDASWHFCPGPVLYSSIYGGEDYDATQTGWKQPVDANGEWRPATLQNADRLGTLREALQPAVRIQNEWEEKERLARADGSLLLDFGKNFAGKIRIRVKGQRGQQVKITPGELLDEAGNINQEFTGDPHYYIYTLSGEGEEEWAPRFTYYGQRYAVIETDAQLLWAKAQEQHASCKQTGFFRCSNEMYNQIHELILGAVRSNMQSVFTDCPHREKLGWLEENHLIGPGILYNFDAGPLYEKLLDDMEDAQTPEGLVPSICPEYVVFDLGFRDSPEWGSSCVLLPWYLYERSGKKELLARHYAMAQRYVAYLVGKSDDYILNYGLGDWLDVGHYPMHPANTPIPVTATAILYQDLCVMAQMAELLERKEEALQYREQAARCQAAFNRTFFYPLSKNYATGSQTSNAMPLFLGIVEAEYLDEVKENLRADIDMRGGHFTGGDVGHPYLIRALGEHGMNDLVAKNFMKTDFPSYGYQVACGATTLCEDWDGPNPAHPVMSQNHFMLGAAEEWFYRYLAGIRVQASQKECIRIQPCFPDTVDWVDCSAMTPAGRCRVFWKKEADGILIQAQLEGKAPVVLCLNGKEERLELEGMIERRIRTSI